MSKRLRSGRSRNWLKVKKPGQSSDAHGAGGRLVGNTPAARGSPKGYRSGLGEWAFLSPAALRARLS